MEAEEAKNLKKFYAWSFAIFSVFFFLILRGQYYAAFFCVIFSPLTWFLWIIIGLGAIFHDSRPFVTAQPRPAAQSKKIDPTSKVCSCSSSGLALDFAAFESLPERKYVAPPESQQA